MSKIVEALAQNVRQLREQHGLSLSQVSERSGIAKATLFKVERGRTNATIETIEAIAETLNVSVATLIATGDRESIVVVRAGEGQDVSDDASVGFILRSQLIGASRLEIHAQRFLEGKNETSASHGAGAREHVVVRRGSLRLGPIDEEVVAHEGDYVTYAADRIHRWQAMDGDAEVWIVHTFPVSTAE